MYRVATLREDINELFASLDDGSQFFSQTSLRMPKFLPFELGFIRSVSYLSVLYREVGRANVEIASSYIQTFDLPDDISVVDHCRQVNELRTFLLHNLNPNSSGDLKIRHSCQNWFLVTSGTRFPEEDLQWFRCCSSIVESSIAFLGTITRCLRKIESDESKSSIIADWNVKRDRMHQPYEFDRLISIAALDMGRENLDPVAFRKRYFEKWCRDLQTLTWGFDFDTEARKLIERALLVESTNVLPITGDDVMRELNIEAGPAVGKMLAMAREFYDQSPCSRSEVLYHLSRSLDA